MYTYIPGAGAERSEQRECERGQEELLLRSRGRRRRRRRRRRAAGSDEL
jgi:hypothetical protein